ncbi:NADPH-dependent F420 reductase [Flavisphingomonas formosensis]|uniref:NADPH-dependent F420 reductase n=1 Tax=Flavisphingomonas formosensis TaxID=861534 RepID=UPI0012FC7A26|nr:NADPH-dependent F420 reductase [Sphingomonas formosensis]
MNIENRRIAVIGGTGNLGLALAARWAAAGMQVAIGSRSVKNAEAAAEPIGAGFGQNRDVAHTADIIVVTVPAKAQLDTLNEIADVVRGKLVVDTTVPLVPPRVARVQLPAEGSAAMRAQATMHDDVELISAFHNVAAQKLAKPGDVGCDVLVFGDKPEMRDIGIALAEKAGMRGIHGGPLANSAAAEAMTSVLIHINRVYGVAEGAGIRISGDLQQPSAG